MELPRTKRRNNQSICLNGSESFRDFATKQKRRIRMVECASSFLMTMTTRMPQIRNQLRKVLMSKRRRFEAGQHSGKLSISSDFC